MAVERTGARPAGMVRRSAQSPPTAIGLNRLLATVALVVIAMRIDLPGNITAGSLLSLALIPVWWGSLARYRGARALFALGGIALLSGVWLTELSSSTNRVDVSLLLSVSMLIAGALAGVGVVLWSRGFMTDSQVALAFGCGLLLGLAPNSALFAENPWKFGFAVPVTVILLALAQQTGHRLVELVVVIGLTIASAFSDARSSFAILMLTALLVFWQLRPRRASRRASTARALVGLATLGVTAYLFAQSLILDGYLGETTRQRSLEQLDASGSLLLGGRPELAATLALLQQHPWGYGAGTVPTLADVTIAKTGMAAIDYDPDNGYVEQYMFGGRFELHSLFGDFWAAFGIPGLLLIGLIAVLVIRGLGTHVAHNTASAVFVYAAIRTLWNVLFGPVYSSIPLLILALGLALLPSTMPRLPGRAQFAA